MNGQKRSDIKPGAEVEIVLKADQPTGRLTSGIVRDILTSDSFHPRGIKVRLISGLVGRVQNIVSQSDDKDKVLRQIRDKAEAFKKAVIKGGIALDYGAQSILKLDEIIDRFLSVQKPAKAELDEMISLFGCFLGEAMIKTLGGHWEKNKNGNMAVILRAKSGERTQADVFSIVEKRFRNGTQDSILNYYQMLQK